MAKKIKGDVYWYSHGKRKTPIVYSTRATSDMLGVLHEENPSLTINEIRALLLDSDKMIYFPEAVKVCEAYIDKGEGDIIPQWRY